MAKKALIISVSDYDDLENLEFCRNDGEEMYRVLQNLGYDVSENRKIIGKVNDTTLKSAIIDFFRDEHVKTTDTLMFYFSGHGVLDGFGGRYFATSNIDSKLPEENGIRFGLLTEQMDRSHSRKTIAILDCCFSGEAVYGITGKSAVGIEEEAEKLGREALSKQFQDSKEKCILASSLSQRRSYSLKDKKMSSFTYFVIEGLKGRKESVNKEGYVTPEKLDEYVYTKMTKLSDVTQTPVRNLSTSDRIFLAYHPKLVKYEQSNKEIVEKIQSENQKNSSFGFWTDVKTRIKSAAEESQKNQILDDFAKSAIESIPVVGVILLRLYENGDGSEEERTKQILTMLKETDKFDEDKLEQFCRRLQKYRNEVTKNPKYLKLLCLDPSFIISKLLPTQEKPKSNKETVPLKPKTKQPIMTSDQTSPSKEKQVKVSPTKTLSHSELYEKGVLLFMDTKYEDAAALFDEIHQLDPSHIDAIRFKGRSLAALNRHKAALFYFEQVLKNSPQDIVILFLKASSLIALDMPSEALECYDEILRLKPGNKVALEKRDELINILSKYKKGKFRKKFLFK